MAVLLSTPVLREPFATFVASEPGLKGAAASVAFIDALDRAREDLELSITQRREVRDAAAPAGPFDAALWVLVDETLSKFRGEHPGPAALELRDVEGSLYEAAREVRMMGHAFVVEPGASAAEPARWRRTCPIEPDPAIANIRTARRAVVALLAAFTLPRFARSPAGASQRAALRCSGFVEPRGLLSNAAPALRAGDELADILDGLAAVQLDACEARQTEAAFEAAAAQRRAEWLSRLKRQVDALPMMVSVGDMRTQGA